MNDGGWTMEERRKMKVDCLLKAACGAVCPRNFSYLVKREGYLVQLRFFASLRMTSFGVGSVGRE